MRIAYVSKFPPSPSGVALYAHTFSEVLRRSGDVTAISAPGNPTTSQSMSSAVTGLRKGLQMTGGYDFAHVELSGRALFEFYFSVGLALRAKIPYVVTCHDAPSVVGAPLLFTALDRRGLRRLGTALSSTLGRRLERLVLRRAHAVLALTGAGARSVSERYGVAATHLTHVTNTGGSAQHKNRTIFVPGYFDETEQITSFLAALVALRERHDAEDWSVLIGACSADAAERIRSTPGVTGDWVRFLGFVDERTLQNAFAEAAVVVRVHPGQSSSNALAASGPLHWAAAHGCVCITDDDRAGALELAALGLVRCVTRVAPELVSVVTDWREGDDIAIATSAEQVTGVSATSARYRRVVPEPAATRSV